MNRKLTYLNLAGVLALAILCLFQWKQNSSLHQTTLQNEKRLQERDQQSAEQKTQLNAGMADLARFKEQYGATQRELTENSKLLNSIRQENLQLLNESHHLKSSLSNWMQAATLRASRIEEANEQIKKLAEDLSAAAMKYNQLATNYNSVVKRLNETRQPLQNKAGAAPKKDE